MKDVRQLSDHSSVFGHFGKASMPAQEEGEIIAKLGFAGPQANRQTKHLRRQDKGEGSHRSRSRLTPKDAPAPAASDPARLERTLAADQPLDPSPFCWFTALLDQSP
jgi:hypothetical protein